MLGEGRDDDGGVLGSLALVNGRGVGRNQRVELTEAVGDGAAVETGGQLARVRVDIVGASLLS